MLISVSWSLGAVAGVEKSIFNLETSLSYYGTPGSSDGMGGINGPFSQILLNLKFGIRIKNVRLKVGRSIILNEYIPQGQERIPLLDIGKIKNKIWGVELQYLLGNR